MCKGLGAWGSRRDRGRLYRYKRNLGAEITHPIGAGENLGLHPRRKGKPERAQKVET